MVKSVFHCNLAYDCNKLSVECSNYWNYPGRNVKMNSFANVDVDVDVDVDINVKFESNI